MSEAFALIVREKRLSLGLSLGQLASQVSRTATTVRAWERAEHGPDDATIRRLASVLAIDVEELRAAANISTPEVTVESADPEVAVTDETGAAGAVAYFAAAAADPGPGDTGLSEASNDQLLLDHPTEAVNIVEIADVPRQGSAGGDSVDATPPAPPPIVADQISSASSLHQIVAGVRKVYDTIFDPEKRYLYWIRAVLLVIGFVVLLRVGKDAASNLSEALGDFLDTFGTGAGDDPTVDSLAVLLTL